MLFRMTLRVVAVGSAGWLLSMLALVIRIVFDPGYEVGDAFALAIALFTSPVALGTLILAASQLKSARIERPWPTAKFHPLATTVFWTFDLRN